MQISLSRIGQIAINAKDIERAIAFYRDTLGMRFLFQAPPQLAFFDCGGVRLMLNVAEKPELDRPGSIIYYVVDDLDATYDTLRARGVEFEHEPTLIARLPDHELWMAFCKDSEGNSIGLMNERRQ